MQVVNGVQSCTENFAGTMQMVQVAPRKIAAGITAAISVKWTCIVYVSNYVDFSDHNNYGSGILTQYGLRFTESRSLS